MVEKDGFYYIIYESSVDYDGDPLIVTSIKDTRKFARAIGRRFKEEGLEARRVSRDKKLTQHTSWINTSGILFPPSEFQDVLDIIKEEIET
jgi:hypothetical protein